MTTTEATEGDEAAEPLAAVADRAQDVADVADALEAAGRPPAGPHAPDAGVRLPWEGVGLDEEPVAPCAVVAEPQTDDAPAEFHVHDDSDEDAHVDVRVAPLTGDDADADDANWHWVATHAEYQDAIGYEQPVPAEALAEDLGPPPKGGGWTVAVLCAGVGLLACCVLIPQADANRRLLYEREKLKADLASVKKQVATNEEFLKRVPDDPNLAERLAQRQMKIIRQGTRVLELGKTGRAGVAGPDLPVGSASPAPAPEEVSPFQLVHVPPPPPMPAYEPVGGKLAELCYQPGSRLYLIGAGLLLMAAGLVLGVGHKE